MVTTKVSLPPDSANFTESGLILKTTVVPAESEFSGSLSLQDAKKMGENTAKMNSKMCVFILETSKKRKI